MEKGKSESDRLLEMARVEERPFTSTAPVIGPLIVRFRAIWNSVAAKWYVRPLLAQQNEFNRLVVEQLRSQERAATERESQLGEQDRETARLIRETAELTAQVIQMNHLLQALDRRLAELEQDEREE